ncbi:S41 family peptidase [Cytophaga hutchinsonii]|uniref:Protease, S41 family n=1 Tax=Cytophaga hutchinsonii (strain ATCC 33406 / DSM 1761 / CIP 103989 / NBRC 15051 / NCIMB 9469 / D465) TaxID=269798 RepID=A0A6N4SVL5_CYTH3|nr:S41 family peptidase [Cytophaga hutchinsonii]ABG60581.1 protease, S41 family [Cytophaga hutchinsonii ATCC 33406]SFX89532.1 Tricorn protease C1 domain-containing protein [Cytophaga hutchinsonii ATCC 33406]
MKKIIYILALLSSTIFFSCEKIFIEKDLKTDDPVENFEYLWKQCDEKYSFFEINNIDWNAIHDTYRAQITDGMSKEDQFIVMGNMLNELKDGHVNLLSDFNISDYHFDWKGPQNITPRVVYEHYIGQDGYLNSPFQHNFVGGGTDVGYIIFSTFPGTMTDDQIDFILNRYKDTKGLIIDVRQNGGGAATDMTRLVSHFMGSESTVYRTRIKEGKGHNDFTALEDIKIKPSDGTKYTKPVYLLTDRGTFSSGSFFTTAMRSLPHVTVMGDTTGGGMGLPNGGQLPNGWTYRFSVTQTWDMDGNLYENGIPPDVLKFINPADTDKDDVIEAAIAAIKAL